MRLHGTDGLLTEGDPDAAAGGWWQDAHLYSRAYTIAGGANEVPLTRIAERALGLPREPHQAISALWPQVNDRSDEFSPWPASTRSADARAGKEPPIMAIEHVLAVVPVTDIDAAREWYERLLGKPPTNRPMTPLAEWWLTGGGWVQVWQDTERAGTALLNLAVDDLPAQVAELARRGIDCGEIQEVNKGVRLSSVTDPDGNTITLIGQFRVDY